MFSKIKQIFIEWFDSASDGEIKIILPYKYRNLKIKEVKIILDSRSNEDGKDNWFKQLW